MSDLVKHSSDGLKTLSVDNALDMFNQCEDELVINQLVAR